MTFEGKVSKILLTDFYSIPSKTKSELSAILGIPAGESSMPVNGNNGAVSQNVVISGVNVIENAGDLWILNPLAIDIRRRLGLDLFSVRTGIIENLTKMSMVGQTNLNVFGGTSLMFGKYLFPSVFVEYDMTLTNSSFGLQTLHTIGLEFDFINFDLGWKYQPAPELNSEIKYEQMFEFNINRRF